MYYNDNSYLDYDLFWQVLLFNVTMYDEFIY